MEETDWLARLRMYLVPFSRSGALDVWDDSRIAAGARWKDEIAHALDHASAAVLLVGPGFLASDFVMEREVPVLLKAATARGVALLPVVVGFCGYNASELHEYQACNSPDQPLESLPRAEQNRILNSIAISLDDRIRKQPDRESKSTSLVTGRTVYDTVAIIQRHLDDTRTAFVAQCRRRNQLVAAIERRLKFKNNLQYEKFFFRYFSQMNEEERFEFDQIRAMTEGPLQVGNRRILEAIEANPAVVEAVAELLALRQHLVFWLNKYDRVFVTNRAMCLLYTGVEDAVPFPENLDAVITSWLTENKHSKS